MPENVAIEPWIERATPTAERLQGALAAAIAEVTGNLDCRAVEIGTALNLGRTMSGRLKRAMLAGDPRELALLLPGRPTMARVMARLGDLDIGDQKLETLRGAYEAFMAQLESIASSQQELANLLREHDPDAQHQSVTRQRQAHFRASAELIGGYAEAVSILTITTPNAEDQSFGDVIAVQGYFGLRRTGSMDPLTVFACASPQVMQQSDRPVRRLDDLELNMEGDGALVRSLSSRKLPASRAVRTPDTVFQVYLSEDLPANEPLDLVTASVQERWIRNVRAGSGDIETRNIEPSTPSRMAIFDQLVHQDMWPGLQPHLRVYRDVRGPRNRNPQDMWFREVAHIDELQAISPQRLLVPPREAPMHAEVARYAIEQSGIDLRDFRAFRLTMPYPVVGQSAWVFWGGHGQASSD